MITYDDCKDMSGLTENEVHAIARQIHQPDIVSIAMGHLLLHSGAQGLTEVRALLQADLAHAREVGAIEHALKLENALSHFEKMHDD